MRSTQFIKAPALECCRALKDRLAAPMHGTVHSVFHTSVNLLAEGQLITLLTEHRPLYPYSVRLAGEALPPLTPGMPVTLTADAIELPDAGCQILLAEASVTDLSLTAWQDRLVSPTAEQTAWLRDAIITHGKTDGFAPLLFLLQGETPPFASNPYADFAAGRIPALFAAIADRDQKAAGDAAYSIAGCGIGLTPSADDFLCGIIAALWAEAAACGETATILPLVKEMADRAGERTGLISKTFLHQAAAGLFSEDVGILIQALYSRVLSQNLLPSVMNVIAFGETSGTDILTGIYFGQKIYPN